MGKIFAGIASASKMNLTLVEIELPSEAGSFFSQADYGGAGYWSTDAIGWAYGGWFPWVWIVVFTTKALINGLQLPPNLPILRSDRDLSLARYTGAGAA